MASGEERCIGSCVLSPARSMHGKPEALQTDKAALYINEHQPSLIELTVLSGRQLKPEQSIHQAGVVPLDTGR